MTSGDAVRIHVWIRGCQINVRSIVYVSVWAWWDRIRSIPSRSTAVRVTQHVSARGPATLEAPLCPSDVYYDVIYFILFLLNWRVSLLKTYCIDRNLHRSASLVLLWLLLLNSCHVENKTHAYLHKNVFTKKSRSNSSATWVLWNYNVLLQRS